MLKNDYAIIDWQNYNNKKIRSFNNNCAKLVIYLIKLISNILSFLKFSEITQSKKTV